jgi:hydrogenase-4 component B
MAGGAAAIAFQRHPRLADRAYGSTGVAGALLLGSAAGGVLWSGPRPEAALSTTLPGGPWVFSLDRLSAWFLLTLALVAMATTLFGIGYRRRTAGHYSIALAQAGTSVLLAAMAGVLVAGSGLLFLFVWEVMAVSGYLLIVLEHDQSETRRAGLIYLVLTHIGTLALVLMFLIWGRAAPDLRFASLATAATGLGWVKGVVLSLALAGFGVKTGVIPLHVWLPGAHSVAPSDISAVLSGLMLKIGVYGILRVLVLVGAVPAWWAWLVFLLGLGSAILGVLWALAERDLKRLLAYSSVENVGLILTGLGLGTLGAVYHQPVVATLGYGAALFHVLSHATSKALLFCGAGAVVAETGTRDLGRLGGLARPMPRTALLLVIGATSLAGLPPLSGFLSEWILVRGLLAAGTGAGPLRFAGIAVAAIALVAALALACFARLVGTILLGHSRDPGHAAAGEAPASMVLPTALLALLALALAGAPSLAMRPVGLVAAGLLDGESAEWVGSTLSAGAFPRLGWLAAGLIVVTAALWLVRRSGRQSGSERHSATWGCGYPRPTVRMQYTAASFGAPILTAFPRIAAAEPIVREVGGATASEDRILGRVVLPAWRRLRGVAGTIRPLQRGRVTIYLQYIVWTLLVLLGLLYGRARGLTP